MNCCNMSSNGDAGWRVEGGGQCSGSNQEESPNASGPTSNVGAIRARPRDGEGTTLALYPTLNRPINFPRNLQVVGAICLLKEYKI